MSWPCYVVREEKQDPPLPDPERPNIRFSVLFRTPDDRLLPWNKLKVGAMYNNELRGIRVKVPGYSGSNYWDMAQPGSDGTRWSISGDIPSITASPSINCSGVYHGWVQGGVVTDDCEGRKFDDFGKLQ